MVDILAIGAHPDDVEFGCGGILVKMASQGKKIAILDLTCGEKGTHGTPEVRSQEAINAASLIGAKRYFLGLVDCEVEDHYENRIKVVKVIRELKPKLVLAPLWKGEQNHPDHLATGQMVRHACRYARFKSILPEIPHHWVEGILHYLPPSSDHVDFIVDVSDDVETWKKMMECHASQMKTFDYVDWNLRIASKYGVLINKPYAQALIKGNPVQVEDLLMIAKGTREI